MTTSTPTSVTDAATQYIERLNAKDLDAAGELWHDDLVEDFVAIGVFRGRAEVRAFFEELFAAMPDFHLRVVEITADDTRAVVQWVTTGNFTGGPFQGIHATGRPVDLRGVEIMHFVDGKLKHNTIYYDGLAFARQVGLLPAAQTTGDKIVMSAFNAKTDVTKKALDLWGKAPKPKR